MELVKVPVWIRQFYPKFVNETCGLHVHMSFKSALHYMRLMSPRYPETITAYMTEWANEERLDKDHPIWARLKGNSEYCQPVFDADRQVRKTKKEYNHHDPDGHRYTMINYCHGTHGTLECRLLPMMETADQAVRAVQRIFDVTNACLVEKHREDRVKGEVSMDPNDWVYREARDERI